MSLLKFYNNTNCEWEVDFKNETWSNILLLTRNFYACSDPLFTAVIASLFIILLVWLLSVITRNYSQVDRLWTILPVIYTWHFVLYDCFKDLSRCNLRFLNARGIIMGILATMWGVRLSYNFMRKGGYNWNGEDYRWPIIQKKIHWIAFEIFNIIFISFYQNILLMLLSAPAYVVWSIGDSAPLNILDLVCCVLFLGFWIGEFIADEQQWNFQMEKRKLIVASSSKTIPIISESNYSIGFLCNGLFRYSRHPNYFCEIGLWWIFYIFSIAAGGNEWILNWSIIGALNLTILMYSSTIFTESISRKKYPMYKEYQKTTSMIIPWFSGPELIKKTT
ncbi:DUF1295-domain-containing protein [Gigaspora margarita]|uniref:DUF1295-domain-containing protein n=1 Tax=Gigaspora margarita TaxID=4874 RepID=A0A8H4ENZ8_GIGMA|nr:DUF1295-domain-containing protein [Gigaspora margarita]